MSQRPEELTVSGVEAGRRLTYQGAACINLEVLHFDSYQSRELRSDHVEYLKRCFRSEGCQRLLPQNHVPVVISQQLLNNALQASDVSAQQLLEVGLGSYRKLDFPPRVQLECLHGQHRIEAGRQFLLPTEQWWIVDLYLSDLDSDVRSSLTEEYAHERHPTDGEIYQKLRQYDAERDLDSKLRWKARLRGIRQKSLNTLYQHEDLAHAFDALLDIPGLWDGMKLSTLHKLFPLRCNEEIVHYLRHIKIFWSGLVQGDRSAMSRIDTATVRALQSRAPRASTMDAKILRTQIRAGEIFSRFNERERDDIWSRLTRTRSLIPTIHTLFRDIQYLEQCVNCVKRLTRVTPRQSLTQAMKQKFKGVNQRQGYFKVQTSDGQFIYRPGTSKDQIDCGYRQLHAFAMRHWPDMPKKPEKKDPQMKARTRADAGTLRRFADLATALGFQSDEIDQLRQYSGPVRTPAEPPMSKPFLVTSGSSVSVKNRCGKPTTCEFNKDGSSLFFHHLHDRQEEQGTNITSFYVRKSVYLAFFGELPSSHAFWRDHISQGSRDPSPENMDRWTRQEFSDHVPGEDLDESRQSQHAMGDYDNILTLYQHTGFRSVHEVDSEQSEARSTTEGEVGRNSTQDGLENQTSYRQQWTEETSERERLELRRIEERLAQEDLQERLAQQLRAQAILDQERQQEVQEKRRKQERDKEEERRQAIRHQRRHEEEIRVHRRTPGDSQRTKRRHTQIDVESVQPMRLETTASSFRAGSVLAHTYNTPENPPSRVQSERLEQERLEQERLEQERLQSLARIKSLKELELERSQQREQRSRHKDMQQTHMLQREQARLRREEKTVDLDKPFTSQGASARPRAGQNSVWHAQVSDPISITFKIRERGTWRTSEILEVPPSDTSQVERIAVKYMRKRIRLYDIDLNVLTPQMCYQAAVANSGNLLLLIPETDININAELEASVNQLLSDLDP